MPKPWVVPPEGPITAHFSWAEARCKCCGKVPSLEAVRITAKWLELVRAVLGQPIRVLSWCRCPAHNREVGGEEHSFHLKGMALDFVCKGLAPWQVRLRLTENRDMIGGIGRYPGFTHVDRGPRRSWEG